MLDTRTAKKEIVLTLTNNSTTENTVVNLLSFGSSSTSTGGASAFLQSVGIDTGDFAGASDWSLLYYKTSAPSNLINQAITDPTDIDDLISKLNALFGNIFWYESDPIFTYSLRVADSRYNFFSVRPTPLPSKVFTTGTTSFISGTSAEVSVGYGVSYNALCTDLTTQPYLLTTMYASSTNQDQSTQSLLTSIYDANGVLKSKPFHPIVDPNQSQNVQMAVPIYMPTSAFNELQYTILAGETVKLVVRYENADLFNALEMIQSGTFQKEMALVRQKSEEEYNRIMETVKGYDVVADIEDPKTWGDPMDALASNKQNEVPLVFAVPLIYVVKKETGDDFVEML